MMDTILEEKGITFKELEKKIYRYACELGAAATRIILEKADDALAEKRDRKKYRDKGTRKTTIKTVYGEVEYRRRVYEVRSEGGKEGYAYLLDEAMGMEKIGLVSANLAEKIVEAATEAPYRAAAESIGSMTGAAVSAGGAWNLVQRLGERVSEEEEHAVRQMESGQSEGRKGLPVLFEEMDGVWLRMQGSGHKKAPMQEMKVSTVYEGWDAEKEKEGRSTLVGKRMLAGMEGSGSFHKKHEAAVRKIYDADEIGQRVLNGDGGSWIGDPYDPDVIVQLDRYHVYQEILRKIGDREAQQEARRLFESGQTEEMLEYIAVYAESVDTGEEKDRRAENARKLHKYLDNNREALPSWKERGAGIPEAPEGVLYKEMGVQENQNCTVVTLRMKHRRMRWSECGANNMAKALYRKENGELHDTVCRYEEELELTPEMKEVVEVLSAAKAPKKDGKGNPYAEVLNHHVPLLDALQTEARKVFREVFVW